MTVREVVLMCCHDNDTSLRELADLVGMSESNLSRALSSRNGAGMKTETLVKLLDALGVQLMVETLNGDDEYILDGEEDNVLDDLREKQAFPDL